MAATVMLVEAGVDGAVFVPVEVDVFRGTSGLRAEVTSTESLALATLTEGRALKSKLEQVKNYRSQSTKDIKKRKQ